MNPSLIEIVASTLFAVAVLHTFLARHFERLARSHPNHAGVWHLFGEVEAVFGIWAFVLVMAIATTQSGRAAIVYLEGLNFTEPMFVFVIMVIAASKPILQLCILLVKLAARAIPLPNAVAFYFVVMTVVPLLGSFVTEPAAMTLAALMLRDRYYSQGISPRLKYLSLGVLFVNISIGGTLTSFAAPPVLMVANTWNWDSIYMLTHFGWKATIGVFINAIAVTVFFYRELQALDGQKQSWNREIPVAVIAIHLAFLIGVVVLAHHPVVFLALFLFFLGFADAYKHYQDRLMLREGLMVALFLAGLVVLGSLQKWWLQPVLSGMNDTALFFGATALTAITDNAALTYLGSLVQGVDEGFKYALVAGAVTGGGLTVIANAPNPAGFSILKPYFDDQAISAAGLFVAALLPTFVAACAFMLL